MSLFKISSKLLPLSLLFCFVSCVQEPDSPTSSPEPVLFERLEEDLLFHTIPTSPTSVSFEFDWLDDYQFKQIYLMQESDTLEMSGFSESKFFTNGRKNVVVDFDFNPEEEYYFLVEVTNPAIPNTRFTYRLPDYKHVFASNYVIESFAEIDRMIDYDFSPSRDFLFVSDFSNNEFNVHRINLGSKTLTTYFEKNEIDGMLIRATSDEEFLYSGVSDEPIDYTIHDQGFIRKMNINTKESTYLGPYSRGYGRVSRVINDVVVVNRRYPNIYDHEAVDIGTGEFTALGNIQAFVNENLFDRIIIGEFEVNPNNLDVMKLTTGEEDGNLIYYDQNEYAFYIKIEKEDPTSDQFPFHYLIVKKDGVKIYETPLEKRGYAFLFNKFNVVNDKFVYYNTFESNAEYKLNGFYEVDLSTGTEKLIHADFHPFSTAIFDFGEKGMYMQRGGTFSLMTKN